MWAKLWKNALCYNAEEHFKNFQDLDQDANDFQDLVSSFSSSDTSVFKFSWKSDQLFLCEVAKQQIDRKKGWKTDRQTNIG